MSEQDDLTWLAGRIGRASYEAPAPALEEPLNGLVEQSGAGVVCEPTAVAHMKNSHSHVIALIGWPTGRHHSLIKAAEARLAVDDGAGEVWVAADIRHNGTYDLNAVLADVIAVSQVIESPTRFGITLPGWLDAASLQEIAEGAQKAGVDVVGVEKREGHLALPDVTCEIAVHGSVSSLDEAADALLSGASRVYPVA